MATYGSCFQLFVLTGSITQRDSREVEHVIAVPLAHALLESKRQRAFQKVLEVISQNIFRRIQTLGFQTDYSDPTTLIKVGTHMLRALAFVPVEHIPTHFRSFKDCLAPTLAPIYSYYESTYVGVARRGRGRRSAPRYHPSLWSQYSSVLDKSARTNNASEGWHNRFQLVVGKKHPSLYSFLTELGKEQADTEFMLKQIELGQKIRKRQDMKKKQREDQIYNVVSTYGESENILS